MRRPTATLVSCALVLASTSLALADDPPPEPPWWPGDRGQAAEHGFALTIPDGYIAFDVTADIEAQIEVVAAELGLGDEMVEAFTSALLEIRAEGRQFLLTTDDANCEIQTHAASGGGSSEALVRQRHELASSDVDILDVELPQAVTLPTGEAWRLSWTNSIGNPELSLYSGQSGNRMFEILCSGQTRPEDDWLHVASAFEWLDGGSTVAADRAEAEAMVPAGPPYPDRNAGAGVYDFADVLGPFTEGLTEQVISDVEQATGAEIVVYTQVKPESDTFEKAMADAEALVDQWSLGPGALVILFDLEPERCYGQIQLYADATYAAEQLSNAERQALFEEEMIAPLNECDFDYALLGAMSRISEAAGIEP